MNSTEYQDSANATKQPFRSPALFCFQHYEKDSLGDTNIQREDAAAPPAANRAADQPDQATKTAEHADAETPRRENADSDGAETPPHGNAAVEGAETPSPDRGQHDAKQTAPPKTTDWVPPTGLFSATRIDVGVKRHRTLNQTISEAITGCPGASYADAWSQVVLRIVGVPQRVLFVIFNITKRTRWGTPTM